MDSASGSQECATTAQFNSTSELKDKDPLAALRAQKAMKSNFNSFLF